MSKYDHAPETQATKFLKANKLPFSSHLYDYEEHGGTSPFGTKKTMPVYLEKSILDLPLIYINGGRRGFLVGVHPHDIMQVLQPKVVEAKLLK